MRRAVLAEVLGAVERRVGALEEPRGGLAVAELGDAGRDPDHLAAGDRHVHEAVVHPLEELRGVVRRRLRHDHRELVAADAAADVDGPDLVAEALRDLGEDGVARQVADAVVDGLEVVEVDDQERQPPVVALRAERLAAKRLVEVALVEEAGERVRLGELPCLAVAARVLDRGDARLRDLLDRRDPVVATARSPACARRARGSRARSRRG